MYELIQVSAHGYYMDCPSKIGLVTREDNRVILIDSGNDKNAAKKAKNIVTDRGWNIDAIVNTHSHADHIGGNAYLQEQTHCAVYAPGIEAAFTAHPLLEPACLYGGNPPKTLRSKFLLAQPSKVSPLTDAVLPPYMSVVPLPGHTADMVGFRVDDVVFLADCLSSEQTLDKYQIGYIWDIPLYLQTLQEVQNMTASLFVPSHAQATAVIAPLAQLNIDKVHDIAARILHLCNTPLAFEDLLAHLFCTYTLTMTPEQYALVGSTVRSYLTWLTNEGKLCCEAQDNYLRFKTV